MDINVPPPNGGRGAASMPLSNLDRIQKNAALAKLINELPPTAEMARFLECADLTADEQRMARKRKLTDIRGGTVDPSAWQVLRWIVASNSERSCCSLVCYLICAVKPLTFERSQRRICLCRAFQKATVNSNSSAAHRRRKLSFAKRLRSIKLPTRT